MSAADEFDLIARLFAPLATSAEARGLRDDAAVWRPNGAVVLTTDALVESVHFFSDDPIGAIAQKAVRVNLSDLIGKGARPVGVLVALAWPTQRPASDIAGFAAGLAEDLKTFDVALWGGDTTATSGPLVVTVTALGLALGEEPPARAGAQPGDDVWVSGTIGDAWLGLQARQGAIAMDAADQAFVQERYWRPTPRMAAAAVIADVASASMDVSDGLIADAGKLAAASGVQLDLEADAIPLSPAARRALTSGAVRLDGLVTGGDDYEALFTAPARARPRLEAPGQTLFSRIGRVAQGTGVRVLDGSGAALVLANAGYRHAIGA